MAMGRGHTLPYFPSYTLGGPDGEGGGGGGEEVVGAGEK